MCCKRHLFMARVTCFWVFLVHLYPTQAQSSVPPVFVQKGKDVLLDVNHVPDKFTVFGWKFGRNGSILVTFSPDNKPTIRPAYTGRIDHPEENKYSVILKNLQEADSGVYTAQVLVDNDLILVQHNIIVQDVVSPVVLKVNSVSNSSHSCNVTLTCSAADSHISSTFRCVNQKCDQDGGNQSKITNSSAALEVHLMNVAVICKHSNRVNSTEDMMDIQQLCPQDTGAGPDRHHIVGGIVGGVVGLLFLTAVVAVYRRRQRNQDVTDASTVYAVPMVETTKAPDDTPDSDEASRSIYSLAGPHGESSGAADAADKPLPESLYAQIEKTPRA